MAEAMGDGPDRDTHEHWRTFGEEFFSSNASTRLVLWNPTSRERKAFGAWCDEQQRRPKRRRESFRFSPDAKYAFPYFRNLEIPIHVIPRWFHTVYTSGVRSMSLYFENPREFMAGHEFPPIPRIYKMDLSIPSPRVTHFVECKRAMLVFRFETGWQVQMTGLLRAAFVPQIRPAAQGSDTAATSSGRGVPPLQAQLRLESFDYIVNHHASFIARQALTTTPHEETIPMSLVRRIVQGGSTESEESKKRSTKAEGADDGNKDASRTGTDNGEDAEPSNYKMTFDKVVQPECPVNEYGITLQVMRCLEITESVCQLRDLMDFTLRSASGASDANQQHIGPLDGLRRLAAQYRERDRDRALQQAAGGAKGDNAAPNAPGTPLMGGANGGLKRKNTMTNPSPASTPRLAAPRTPQPPLSPSASASQGLGSPNKRLR